jgi:hypothetical protein
MLDNYQDLIDELLETPKAVRELSDQGELSPEARALLTELRDRDQLVLERLRRMTTERTPHLRPLPDKATLAANRAEPDGDTAAILSSFDTARGDLVAFLMNLTLRDWEKTATQDTPGTRSVADEVEDHVEFDEEHLEAMSDEQSAISDQLFLGRWGWLIS